MTAPLVPCAECARHLRADAERCPFCGAARAAQQLAYVPVPRLARSAMAALGAVLAVAPVAALTTDADAQPHHHTLPRPLYGVPSPPLRPVDAVVRADASVPADASVRADTANPRRRAPRARRSRRPDDEGGMQLMYGVPPKPSE